MKGATEPRIFTPPLRELMADTSLGFAAVEYGETVLKKKLYPWQKFALIHGLEIIGKLPKDWHFRFRTVVVMVARQNGKTVLSEVIASFFLNVLGVENVFGTSLSLDKAEEVWEAVVRDQEEIPMLEKNVDRVGKQNGNKRLILKGNRVYKVGAPTRRAGRGDSNDLVMLDEVREHRDWETWSAAAASINAKPNGIIFCFSNAGDPDSIVLRQLRSQAIEAMGGTKAAEFGGEVDGDTLCLLEWSAPDGADITDIEAITQANPALGYGALTERAILANAKTFPEAKFRSECLCQQVETILPAPFPDGAWEKGADPASQIAAESPIYYGVDMSQDRRWVSIAACGLREDGNWHIEVITRRIGAEWVVDWFRERAARHSMNIAFQSRGAPVAGLAEVICSLHGVERNAIEGPDLTNGWGRFFDAVRDGHIFHLEQPVLDTAAHTMQLRQMGGGVELPDRVKSPDDISPLFACIMAFTAANKTSKEKKVYESSYAKGNALVFI